MGLDRAGVLAIMGEPETDYPSRNEAAENCRVATRGNVAVVYTADGTNVVITVLYHGRDYSRPKIAPTKSAKRLRRAKRKHHRTEQKETPT
jgi:hypothetical protein